MALVDPFVDPLFERKADLGVDCIDNVLTRQFQDFLLYHGQAVHCLRVHLGIVEELLDCEPLELRYVKVLDGGAPNP